MACELRRYGVTLNLAPVVDLNLNPNSPIIGRWGRSFGADARSVVRYAQAFVQGHRDAGVLTALKHFPGHGTACGDTHKGAVNASADWRAEELRPYRLLTQANTVDLVMTAHVFVSELDPDAPASLSARVIEGRLRHEIGFDGVVITDDLQMVVAVESYANTPQQAALAALAAGNDLVLLSNFFAFDRHLPARIARRVVQAVRSGVLSVARIDQAFARVAALKQRLNGANTACSL
ncbi:putative beta-hexosaminidase [Magnetofaba australis IT-1]|uniref:beta-N-acetylhexosaminidase n=2 Tax=Magnetofaba TaxID=1472292 RepID=A0A1Y2K8B7_9PROT|nr:putative beta-hexosaminidase [Magnetofaba australis IT-1]